MMDLRNILQTLLWNARDEQSLPEPRFPTENYLNRELGLLAFSRRVLAQGQDDHVRYLSAYFPLHRFQQPRQ